MYIISTVVKYLICSVYNKQLKYNFKQVPYPTSVQEYIYFYILTT